MLELGMYKLPLLLILTIFSAILSGVANGQDLKVGYMDISRVLKDAPQSELARKTLKQEFNPRDQKIVTMQKNLKKLSDRQERDAKLMSKADNIKLERQIVSLKRDIKRAKEEFNEDFNLRRNEELAKLHKLINKTTVSIAKKLKYDIILSDNVLYNSERVDITDMVITELKKLKSSSNNTIKKSN